MRRADGLNLWSLNSETKLLPQGNYTINISQCWWKVLCKHYMIKLYSVRMEWVRIPPLTELHNITTFHPANTKIRALIPNMEFFLFSSCVHKGPFKNDVTGGRREGGQPDRWLMVTREEGVLASGDVTIKKIFNLNFYFCTFLKHYYLNNLIQLFEVIHTFFISFLVLLWPFPQRVLLIFSQAI